jgi:hypothetical protein
VDTLDRLLRVNRAAQLAARQGRSRAKGLRAQLRAGRLAGRKLVTRCGELRSRLAAEKVIQQVTGTVTPGSARA